MRESLQPQLVISCDSSTFQKVHDFVRRHAAEAGFNRTEVGRWVLAADEICSNIIKHTYRFDSNHKLTLSWHDRENGALLEIEDDSATPYLPSPSDFDLPTKIKYRQSNGYGKYLLKGVVDDVHYETVPGSHNKVSLLKLRDGAGEGKKEWGLDPLTLARVRALSLKMILEVGESMSRQTSVDELMKVFLYAVMGRLATHPVVVFAPVGGNGPFGIVGQMGLSRRISMAELQFPRHGWVVETLWAQRGPFLAKEFGKIRIPDKELEVLTKVHAALLLPLFVLNRLQGILALGPKRTSRAFSEDDVNVVAFLGTHLLLLWDNLKELEKGPAGPALRRSGEIRAALRAAVAKLHEAAEESGISLELPEGLPLKALAMDGETLGKLVLTLLTHILYLAKEGEKVSLSMGGEGGECQLEIQYKGTPLGFEKGKPGYNTLVDQMVAEGLRLNECRKMVQSQGGKLEVKSKGEKVTVALCLPFA